MSTRKKIENYCKEHKIKIISLEFIRKVNLEFTEPYWELVIKHKNKEQGFESDSSNDSDISEMLQHMQFWIDEE